MKQKINICGTEIDNLTFAETMEEISRLITKKAPAYIVTPNIDHIVKLRKDGEFRKVYAGAALVLADGMPLLWAAKFFGTPLKEKISGSDLLPNFCRLAVDKGFSLFFLGGREGAVEKAAQIMQAKYPGIRIVGTYCPPVGFEKDIIENTRVINKIKEAHPDVLFVGLGAPKQEKWAYKFKDQYQVPVSAGIGVSFEFIAGMVKRAPLWMQRSGLEWLWRLMMEPGRLWKRYILDDSVFFWLVLKQKLGILRAP
jgi:N-acetylglucosaminyldiphosphoundecaprenol N-acetyl-beta-D-mannosaminyltransferase